MAKYNITYSCGHSGTENIVGPHKDREYRIRKLSERVCPDCYKAEKAAGYAAQAVEAAKATTDMIALTGSEKQVAWATTIRAGAREAIDTAIAKVGQPLNAQQADAIDMLFSQAGAGWWIDRRANGVNDWLKIAASLARA